MQALTLLTLHLNAQAFNIDLIFFGLRLIPTGYLTVPSTFLSRIIGVLLMLDGLRWVTYPSPRATAIYPVIVAVAAFAKLPWLLVFDINAQRWQEQARAAAVALSFSA